MHNTERELKRWGVWAREQLPGRIKPLAIYRDGSTGKRVVEPMTDEEARHFDPAVAALREASPELYNVVRQHYIYGLSCYAIGKIKSKNSKDISMQVKNAQNFVSGFIYGAYYRSALEKSAGFAAAKTL